MKSKSYINLTILIAFFISINIGNLFAQTVTVGTGSVLGNHPIYCYYGYTYSQSIYLQSEIATSGNITAIRFQYTGSAYTDNIIVGIGHTTKTAFSNTTDWIPAASLTNVYSGNYSYGAATGWYEITLTTPFAYNNTDNLVIAVDENTAGYHSSSDDFYNTTVSGNRSLYYYSDATNPNPASPPTGTLTSQIANVQLVFAASGPMTYSSSTVTQASVASTLPGNTNQEVICIQVATTGLTSPLSITNFRLRTTGSTDPVNDIQNAKIWFTGNSSTFATTTQFGATYSPVPAVGTNYNLGGSQVLSSGTNYFWLTYDIKGTATLGNVVDALCNQITVGGSTYTPTVTAPAGNRPISLSYCTNTNTTYTSYYINNFSTTGGTTNITNNGSGFSTNGYGDFTGMIVAQEQGSSVNFSITEVGGTMHFGIWVDWNQDGDFVDAGEEVYIDNTTYQTTATGSFSVPGSATLGNTRMRVVGNELGTVDACTGTSYTECEDYTFTVNPGTSMTYISSAVTQANTTPVSIGSNGNEVIGIQVLTSGSSSPLSVTQFTVNASGTTAIADINAANSAKIYYTGTSSTFATTTLFGQNTPTIANFTIGGSQTLSTGTNYFWLVYDVKGTATAGNVIDGQCASLNCGGAKTPSPTTVAGSRPIVNQVTIGTGTSTGSYPFYTNWGYTRSASLFTAAEVGSPTVITQLAWNISTAQTTNIPVKIYLITTTATTLTSDTWANMISGATLVYDATTSFTPTGWKTFDITDYVYCTDNLIVLCEANYGGSGAGSTVSFYYTTATNCHETWYADSSPPTGSGSVSSSRPNIKIDKTAAVMCSGVPTPGTASASPTSICVGESSLLSVTGSSTTCGLTYQWQSGAALGGPYTDITGATSSIYTASPSVSTYYRRAISCGANTAYTTGVLVSVTGPSYAAIGYTCGFNANWTSRCDTREIPDDYWVANPVTGDDSWRRHNDGAAAAWIADASGIYSPVSSEGTRSARFHSYETSNVGTLDLYIDLSTQTGTKMLSFDYINTSGSDVLTVLLSTDGGATFPTTLKTVTTAATWTTYYAEIVSESPTCVIRFSADGDYGSTDIGLDAVAVNPPCSGVPAAGTASSNIANYCNTGTPTLSLSGFDVAGDVIIQWQASVTNSPYSWSNIGGQYSAAQYAPYTVSPAINQTTYFRASVSCGANTSYSNIVTVSNSAQSILSTNSPVTVVCNTSANMTATATGGTISWYANATGGTALATGGSYNTVVTANTTFYCAAGSGGSTTNVGKTPWVSGDGYVGISNWGIRFNAISAFTLVSVQVYPQTAGQTISVVLQDNTGTPIGSPVTFTSGTPGVAQTLTLNMSIPVGNDYRLVTGNSTSLGRDWTGIAFPYTAAGVCSLTASEWGGTTTGTYYYFYNWVVSTGCESSPRTPVDVIVSGGVTAPVCSANPSPAHLATNVCPVGLILSWDASTTACRAATGYKLYFGTDAGATNIINGADIGNVTSYNVGTISGSTIHYWKIVPYNTAGDATGCSTWRFTTASNPGNICITNMGNGVVSVPSLPYASGSGTTHNKDNDLTSANTVTCGSSSYLGGEDQVFVFTPTASGSITINLTSSGSYTGLMLYDGCPLTGVTCGAIQGNCVAYSQGYDGTRTLTTCVTAGITYYLVLDSWPSPDYNPYSNLTISAPSGSVATNDLACDAIPLSLGVQANGDNACTGGASEPATPSCWTYGTLNTIWYSVVCPASGQLTIQTTLGTLTNTQIAVYSGTCSSLSLVSGACNTNITGCGSGSNASQLLLSGLSPGATYYIRVDGGYDLIGSFSILAIDGTTALPTTLGQDCAAALPTCATSLNVSDPGYSGTGSICDFDGSFDCTGGDRAAVFYTIEIASAGQLMFDIVPNDYSGGYPGDGTDYDFIIWKIAGSGTLATCASIMTNSSIGMMACNYSYIDVTGLYTGGNAPAAYGSGFDPAYEAPITVAPGDIYLLWISNFSLSTSGFTIDYSNSTPSAAIINIAPTPTLVAWTGATSTAWNTASNWGGCGAPNTCGTSVVIPGYMPTMPVISTNISVNDLTINTGGTLTINTGRTLTICGNFVNNGTLIANGTARVIFAGSNPQACTNNSGTLTIPNVTINNTGGGVTLGGNGLTITNSLTFTSGILNTSSTALLIMNAGSFVTPAGGTSSCYVDGPMQKLGNTAFIFPLGDGSVWARLGISAPTASSTFRAEYFATPYSTLTPMDLTQGAATLDHVSSVEHWILDRVAGTGNTSVTLYWENAASSGIWLCASYLDLSVARWTGSAWTNLNPTGGTLTGTCGTFGTVTTQAAVSSFSPFTFASIKAPDLNPLPVDLLSFTGKRSGDVNVLEWKTVSENNNDYFVLYKSNDGKIFEELARVKGYENSRTLKNYLQIDDLPYHPVTYYKLKQVDLNGYYKYSDVISIGNSDQDSQPLLIDLYPNPASTKINLVVFSPVEGEVYVEIVDIYGRTMSKELMTVNFGRDVLVSDINTLTKGVYVAKITFVSFDHSDFKRFVKQ